MRNTRIVKPRLLISRCACAILLLLGSPTVNAQVPPGNNFFQSPTPTELELKECPFDPEADAVILFDKAWAYYNDNWNLITERHVRLKIFRDGALDQANIEIPYYADKGYENVTEIRAAVWNGGGQPVWMDKKAVFIKKKNALYNVAAFTVPNVAKGSIIEYTYVSTKQSVTGLSEWQFQSYLPTVYSFFHLKMVPTVEFSYTVNKSPDRKVNLIPDQANNAVAFSMDNIPGLRHEPFMDARMDYLQRISFQLSAISHTEQEVSSNNISREQISWDELTKRGQTDKKTYTQTWAELNQELLFSDDYGGQLKKSLDVSPAMNAIINGNGDPFQKMRAIHAYVRSTMKWNDIYSQVATDNIKKVWTAKTGTATEINLILINLLKAAKLDVKPLLASERSHGKVDTVYPIKKQFNLTVALVDLQGKRYVLDATDLVTPTYMIPSELIHTRAFMLDDKNFGIIQIPDNGAMESETINLMSSIDAAGKVTGEVTLYDMGYSRIHALSQFRRDPKKYGYAWPVAPASLKVDTVEVEGAEKDSAAFQTKVTYHDEVTATGGYLPIRYDLFTDQGKNPFTAELRFSDINFGARQSFTLNADYDLDPSWTVESVPQNLKLVSPDQSMTLTRMVRHDGQSLSIVLKFECTRYGYLASEYDDVQGFYKKMAEVFAEPVMLKKASK